MSHHTRCVASDLLLCSRAKAVGCMMIEIAFFGRVLIWRWCIVFDFLLWTWAETECGLMVLVTFFRRISTGSWNDKNMITFCTANVCNLLLHLAFDLVFHCYVFRQTKTLDDAPNYTFPADIDSALANHYEFFALVSNQNWKRPDDLGYTFPANMHRELFDEGKLIIFFKLIEKVWSNLDLCKRSI